MATQPKTAHGTERHVSKPSVWFKGLGETSYWNKTSCLVNMFAIARTIPWPWDTGRSTIKSIISIH